MYKLAFVVFLVIFTTSTAYAHKVRCEDGYFYVSGECVDAEITGNDSAELNKRFDSRSKILYSAVDDLNALAILIEKSAPIKEQEKYFDDIATKGVNYVENHLGTHKALNNKIRMRRGTEHTDKYNKDISGLSIYKALFELYDIFDEAEIHDYNKRDITAKHKKRIDPINDRLITSYRAFAAAYKSNNDYSKEKQAYYNALRDGITLLASIYADEVKQLGKSYTSKIEYGRNEVISDLREDIAEDTEEDIQRLMQHRGGMGHGGGMGGHDGGMGHNGGMRGR